MASERCDTQLDCFHDAAGYCRRIGWHPTRKFAASVAEARTLACGATFSPAAPGGRMPHRPSTMCIWDGCTELGTFGHIAWGCPRRSCNIPKPAEFLSSRYGWVVANQDCVINALHGWLVHVQETLVEETLWPLVHP